MKINRQKARQSSVFSDFARHPALKVSLLAMAIGAPLAGHAQEQPAATGRVSLEEIIVTATRRAQDVQSIPVSIAAVSGADLEKQGISSFAQLGQAVSGLSLVQPEGFVSSSIYVRGVGTSGTNPADSSVGVVVDGVYQLKLGAVFSEMLDVERVEILRGPQGTLFGKNTTAGLVVVKTNDPDTEEFSGRIQGVAGNLDARELRGVVNIPLIEDKLAVRLSGFTAKRDGYTDNLYIDKDTRNVDREGFRGKLLWNITDSLNVVLSGEKVKQSSRMDQSLVEYPDRFLNNPVLAPHLPPIGLGKAQQQASSVEDDIERYIMTVNWDIPNHTFTSISSYEESIGSISTDQDHTILGAALPGYPDTQLQGLTYITNSADTEVLTQEFQLASNWDGPFNYIVGAFWQNETLESTTAIFMNGSDVGITRPPSVRDVDSKAVFGNVSYRFNEQWDASLGVRYTEDEKEGQNNVFSGVTKFDETTYSFKLSYTPDDDKMFYFAYDTGFKSGGVNREFGRCGLVADGMCLDPSEALWEPETTDNYEIGMKTSWLDNTLRVNGALFYQTYDDYQVSLSVPGEATTVMANAAEVESMGLETDVTWLVGNHLTLSGSLSYILTRYDQYANAPCLEPSYCSSSLQDLSGKRLDQAPRLSYNLAAEWRDTIDHFNGVEWFARAETSYKGDHNLHLYQSPRAEQDGFHLVNARVGFESPDKWRVTAWANNLTDKEYIVFALDDGAGLRATPGISRTYGVTLDWFF